MKPGIMLIAMAALIAAAFLYACDGGQQGESNQGAVTAEDVKKEAREAIETATAYTRQEKEEYVDSVATRIEQIDRKMQEMQARANAGATQLKEKGRVQFNQSMEALRQKRQKAAQELKELESESGKAWSDVKKGMDSALEELDEAFDRAQSHFE